MHTVSFAFYLNKNNHIRSCETIPAVSEKFTSNLATLSWTRRRKAAATTNKKNLPEGTKSDAQETHFTVLNKARQAHTKKKL